MILKWNIYIYMWCAREWFYEDLILAHSEIISSLITVWALRNDVEENRKKNIYPTNEKPNGNSNNNNKNQRYRRTEPARGIERFTVFVIDIIDASSNGWNLRNYVIIVICYETPYASRARGAHINFLRFNGKIFSSHVDCFSHMLMCEQISYFTFFSSSSSLRPSCCASLPVSSLSLHLFQRFPVDFSLILYALLFIRHFFFIPSFYFVKCKRLNYIWKIFASIHCCWEGWVRANIECPRIYACDRRVASTASTASTPATAVCYMCQLWNTNRESISALWINYFSVDKNAHTWFYIHKQSLSFEDTFQFNSQEKKHIRTHILRIKATHNTDRSKTMNPNWVSFDILLPPVVDFQSSLCVPLFFLSLSNIIFGSSSHAHRSIFDTIYFLLLKCSQWADVNRMHRRRQKLDWHATFSNYMSCSFYSWLINTPSLAVRAHAPFKWGSTWENRYLWVRAHHML